MGHEIFKGFKVVFVFVTSLLKNGFFTICIRNSSVFKIGSSLNWGRIKLRSTFPDATLISETDVLRRRCVEIVIPWLL